MANILIVYIKSIIDFKVGLFTHFCLYSFGLSLGRPTYSSRLQKIVLKVVLNIVFVIIVLVIDSLNSI